MTRVSVEFDWSSAGEITLQDGRPTFPRLPEGPGLYRFTFEGGDQARAVYIGESDGLRRRAQHYRTPGATQRTNLRMNKEIVEALAGGFVVTVATITSASVAIDGNASRPVDLSRKTSRQIVENAAMAEVIGLREADPTRGPRLMNRPGVGEEEWN
jgi:hypothetical protein